MIAGRGRRTGSAVTVSNFAAKVAIRFVPNGVICVGTAHGPTVDRCPILPDERASSLLLAARNRAVALSVRRCLVSALLAAVMSPARYRCMLSESLPKTALAWSSATGAARPAGEGHLLRGCRDGQGDADEIFAIQTGGVADGGADADHVLAAYHADRVPVFVPVDVEEHGRAVSGRELFDGLPRYHDAVWNRARR
jgi:hypothetical protein